MPEIGSHAKPERQVRPSGARAIFFLHSNLLNTNTKIIIGSIKNSGQPKTAPKFGDCDECGKKSLIRRICNKKWS